MKWISQSVYGKPRKTELQVDDVEIVLQRKEKSYFFRCLYKISLLTCFISIIGIVSNINNLLQISMCLLIKFLNHLEK